MSHPEPSQPLTANYWWRRPDLEYRNQRLHLGQGDLINLANKVGTPTYVIRAPRVLEKLQQLHAAFDQVNLKHKIYYAIKANRSARLLTYLASHGLCGADVCSPEEMIHALSCGFAEKDISFTGTSLSRSDINTLAEFDGVNINLDSLSAIKQLGLACPGRDIGLRINPDIGIGYADNDLLQYSGAQATKFGIYLDRLPEAIKLAQQHQLNITRIHFHAGCGYLDRELNQLGQVLEASQSFLHQLPNLREINIGGGLGVPHTSKDKPLDLNRWGELLAQAFSNKDLTVAVEPGDFLIKDAGVLLAHITYVEQRKSVKFVGLNAGFNLAMEPAFYGLPCEPVAAHEHTGDTEQFTLVGNVNEALDKWAENHPLADPQEDDVIALINAGGYASSMRSEHCLRGDVKEILLLE